MRTQIERLHEHGVLEPIDDVVLPPRVAPRDRAQHEIDKPRTVREHEEQYA
eukprot:CAMPEP_0198505682 /NCGR_PEP_ID=MMETSP1462-20131121/11188_1 /TAXON_ID=1333877 /ORGANISM="Brandtodinium nutriculum, Strain RCC3387" /LENGTH=50 /DNA_ID=CAMNT_0044234871 /DNA_START=31 /DNA_END=180 /DNA_ORIENTATION=-